MARPNAANANCQPCPVSSYARDRVDPATSSSSNKSTTAALFAAAASGELHTLAALLETHTSMSVDVRNDDGDTLLHVAARAGYRQVVQYLVFECDAALEARNRSGCTPLLEAIGNVRVAHELIRAGADVNAVDAAGYSCVVYAVAHVAQSPVDTQSEAPLRLLVASGADVDARHSETTQTALHVAATLESVHAMMLLLELGADVSAVDCSASTVVDVAAARGSLRVLQWLEMRGLTHDFVRASPSACTPLVRAAAGGHLNVVQFLVTWQDRRRAPRDGRIQRRREPRLNAWRGHRVPSTGEVVTEQRGSTERNAALYAALLHGAYDVVVFLCEHGARASSVGGDVGYAHTTALHIAAKCGRVDLAEFFIERERADVNYSNQRGRTPLHTAAIEGDVAMVRLLLMHGADVDARAESRLACMATQTADRLTPLQFALWHGHYDVAALLLQHGASAHDRVPEAITRLMGSSWDDEVDRALAMPTRCRSVAAAAAGSRSALSACMR